MVLFCRRVTPVKKLKPALGISPMAEVVKGFGFIYEVAQAAFFVRVTTSRGRRFFI